MGDLRTHEMIAHKVIGQLQTGRPEDDYVFFHLGNWLTDMSQFRDPPAYAEAKISIWNAAAEKRWYLNIGFLRQSIGLHHYLDALFGLGEQGYLWRWCGHLISALGLTKFQKQGVSVQQFEDLFKTYWSQYFPHEHLDCPPKYGNFLGDRTASAVSKHCCGAAAADGGKRQTFRYLEDQLVWVADLLTAIQSKWAIRQPDEKAKEKERHRLLARYGHASHAVEDFFFHSNFVEIAWNKAFPEKFKALPIRQKRILLRRLRQPKASGETLSKTESLDPGKVYTGYFGANDIFHTLVGGLREAIEHAQDDPDIKKLAILELVADVFTEGDADSQAEKLRRYRKAAEEDTLLAQDHNEVDSQTFEHLRQIVALDLELAHRGKKEFPELKDSKGNPYGILGMLQMIGLMARDMVDASEKRSAQLDQLELVDAVLKPTDNGASGENIGSHSLLSKDGEHKLPLRQEAVQLATRVAVYIAQRMMEKLESSISAARSDTDLKASQDSGSRNTFDINRLDWLHLLRHFAAHPDESEKCLDGKPWWMEALDQENSNTAHNPVTITLGEVDKRIQEEPAKAKSLGQDYNSLVKNIDEHWSIVTSTEVPL